MQKDLADIISEINAAGVTGILTLSMNNDPSLFKIFFRDGNVYHLTHGTCKDMECLVKINDLKFITGLFMPRAQVDMKDGAVIPIMELIDVVKKAKKAVEWNWDGGAKLSDHFKHTSAIIDSMANARMEEELLNIVGPVAPMVLKNAYGACNLKQGVPMTKPEFLRLIKTISEKLPEEHKKPFLNQFG